MHMVQKQTCCRFEKGMMICVSISQSNLDGCRHLRVRSGSGDATLAGIHRHIAAGTPAGTPAVLHLDGVSIIANSQDTVIQVGAASGSDDTTCVLLEDGLVGLDGDGNWVLVEGTLKTRSAVV